MCGLKEPLTSGLFRGLGGTLIVGFNKDDGGYDTNKEFVKKTNKFFEQGTEDLEKTYLEGTEIKLVAPLIDNDYDKKAIRKELERIGLFDLTYSCYVANGPCGECAACMKREGAQVSSGNKPV